MKNPPTLAQLAQFFALIRDGKVGEDEVGELLRPYLTPPLPRRSSPTGQTRVSEPRTAAKKLWRFHAVDQQLSILRTRLPHLNTTYVEGLIATIKTMNSTNGAAGIAAWPKITRAIAQPSTDARANYHYAMHAACTQLERASLMTMETKRLIASFSFAANDQTLQRYAQWEATIPGDIIVRPVWTRYAHEARRDMGPLVILDAFAIAWFLLLQGDALPDLGQLLISTTDGLAIGTDYQDGFVNWEWSESLTLTAARSSLPQDVGSCLSFFVQQS